MPFFIMPAKTVPATMDCPTTLGSEPKRPCQKLYVRTATKPAPMVASSSGPSSLPRAGVRPSVWK